MTAFWSSAGDWYSIVECVKPISCTSKETSYLFCVAGQQAEEKLEKLYRNRTIWLKNEMWEMCQVKPQGPSQLWGWNASILKQGFVERCVVTLSSQGAVSVCPAREGQDWGDLSAEPLGPGCVACHHPLELYPLDSLLQPAELLTGF